MLRRDLDHLPERIRRELGYVVRILFEEVEDAMRGAASDHRRAGQILKVILFGSFAGATGLTTGSAATAATTTSWLW